MFTVILTILFGGFALSVPDIAEAKEKRPTREEIERAESLAAEGWQLWQRRDMVSAEKKFEQAVQLDPSAANAWNGFGWALFNSGQPTKALRAFDQCVKLEPSHAAGLNGLGQLHLSRGEYELAEKHLKKSAKNPYASAAWWGLTKVYLLTGEFKKALPWAKKVAGDSPNDEFAQQMLAAATAGKLSAELRQKMEPASARKKTVSPETQTATEDVTECLEDLRRTAICYNLSFDQVLDEHLSRYDEGRMELFPGQDAWPGMLGFIAKDPAAYQTLQDSAPDFSPKSNGGTAFAEPLAKPIVVGGAYQTLVFLDGIAKNGAVLIDSYATVYCRGDMAGVINSQSYSTTVIRGVVASGRMRNASYGNWVIYADMSGKFEFESAGTLRILGRFAGKIKLGSGRYKRRGKVFLAGHTPKSELDRIEGAGTVYLEKSDLEVGSHEVGKLTVIVGDDR